MLRSVSVLTPSRLGRSQRLWAGVSAAALGAAVLAPQAASAASFSAGTEQQFRDAVAAAAASPDNQSTITLTGGFAVAAPVALPDKLILVDPAGFTVTGLTFNGAAGSFVVIGAGLIPLVGSSTTATFTVNAGEVRLENGAQVTASNTATVNGGTLIVDDGTLTAGSLTVNGGTSTIRIRNGGVVYAAAAAAGGIGLAPSSTLDLLVTGAGSRLDFGAGTSLGSAGSAANAAWTIADRGAATVAQGLIVGSQVTAQANAPRLTVTGAGSTLGLGSLTFYRGAVSVLDGGALTVGAVSIGPRLNNGAATLLVSDPGSSLIATGAVTLGASAGPAIVTLRDGGLLDARGAFTVGAASNVGVVNIGGGESDPAAAAGVLDTAILTFGPNGRLNFKHTESDYDFAPTITGAGAINQRAGVTRLTGVSSTYSGTATISGGALQVDGMLGGSASSVVVNGGGVLGGSGTIGGNVAVTDGVVAPGNSPGTLTIAGNLTLAPTSTLDVEFGESNVVGGPMNDLIKIGGNLTLDGTVDVSVTAGGVFDAGLYRIISYGGTLTNQTLDVGATPGGGVTVQTAIPGQVNLVNTGGLPVNFWDGDGAGGANNSRVDGGNGAWTGASLTWTTGAGAVNTAYTPGDFLIFAGAPGLVNAGAVAAGGMQFAVDGYRVTGGPITLTTAATPFRVGDGTADGRDYVTVIDAPLVGASNRGLAKTDLGTLILNGANTYGYLTTVQAGTLLVNGSIAGGGNATVVGAAGTLGGTGTIRGGVVTGTLAPGGLDNPGTLTVNGGLTFGPGAILRYRLGQAGAAGGALNDLLVINGALNLNGTLNVTQSAGGAFGAGVYRLIDYTSGLTDNVLDVGGLPTGFNGVVQTSIANQVNLVVDAVIPPPGGGGGGVTPPAPAAANFWDGGGAGADGSIAGGDGVWRADTANWTTADGSANADYAGGLFAIFAAAPGTVTVDGSAGAIGVSGLQFAADGYRLTGDPITLEAADTVVRVGDGTTDGAGFKATIASALTGSGRLDKTDAGTLVLTGENSYAGGTRVSGGTLQLGDGGERGSVLGDIEVEGALAFNRADGVTLANAISGPGLMIQAGAGATTLTADSSAFTGLSEVRAGTLAVDGRLGGTTTVFSGARLTGSGQVGSLNNEAGGVVAPGHSLGVLTVAGDYVGAGGVLELDARLGGAAEADRLVVQGSTAGQTLVKLNRLAGGGAPDPDGVVLVEVGGASEGTFALADGDYRLGGEAVLVNGAYGYVLRQDGGDWRLRSGEGASAPLYQPGVPVYEAYGQVLQLLNGVGTMRQRTGERRWSGEAGSGVWGRIEGGHARLEPGLSTTAANLKADRWKLQFGVDHALGEEVAGGRLTGGLTAHYGGAKADVASLSGAGDIDAKGYGVGANLTWSGTGGGYVDVQAQASWFDADLSTRQLGRAAEGTGGDGYALSLEGGKAFAAGEGLQVTPQAQLSYARVDFDGFTDRFGAVVSNDRSDSLMGRLGLSVDYALGGRGGVYGLVNVSREFLDSVRTDVSGVRLENRPERTWGGLAAGGSYSWGDGRFSVYGEASADTSLASFGDSYDLGGTIGLRMRF